ncbi:TetR/AcrR family transcriptional regulator [Mycobacterium sp.]|uniref:TetR/AcrR family transcriptional regulator n=1 Tax=Mycobacterium sp. TaxID=1785 RepID=UPI003D6C5157
MTTIPKNPAGVRAVADARRIMRAAVACFRELGYGKSSMKKISARAGVSQSLLHYHFDTEANLFESTMANLAETMFAAAAASLPRGKSVQEGLAAAADLLYTLFISNPDAVTFTVELTAAANHNEFLRMAYASYRDAQRRQLANVLRGIVGDRAPASLIDETVRSIETVLLGMSMQRPFISDEPGFRADFDACIQTLTSRFIDKLESASS